MEKLFKESMAVNWSKSVQSSVVINASLDEVWEYASDSTKASEWSVYFDHISPFQVLKMEKKALFADVLECSMKRGRDGMR